MVQHATSGREKRLTDRVAMSIPIRVQGKDTGGEEFVEECQTLSISRHGATILLGRLLAPGQLLKVCRPEWKKEAMARVLGRIGGRPSHYVYGLASQDPIINIWDIVFPPLAEARTAVARLLLECGTCQSREVVYLEELETEVFEANGSLSRSCGQCGAWTVWNRALSEGATTENAPSAEMGKVQRGQCEPGANKRKHVRVPLSSTGCVRQPGFGEDVVSVDTVSRGGLSFLSRKSYLEGSRIEIALSFLRGGPNIFVPARVVWSRPMGSKDQIQYGVEYIQPRES